MADSMRKRKCSRGPAVWPEGAVQEFLCAMDPLLRRRFEAFVSFPPFLDRLAGPEAKDAKARALGVLLDRIRNSDACRHAGAEGVLTDESGAMHPDPAFIGRFGEIFRDWLAEQAYGACPLFGARTLWDDLCADMAAVRQGGPAPEAGWPEECFDPRP